MARKPISSSSDRSSSGRAPRKKSKKPAQEWQWTSFLASSLQEQHRLVGAGLPYTAAEHLRQALGLTLGELAALVTIQLRTLSRRSDGGRLEAAESDRLLRAARLFGRTTQLFDGDVEKAREWLRTDNRALGRRSPLEFARTEVGAREVEALIGRLEHGVFT